MSADFKQSHSNLKENNLLLSHQLIVTGYLSKALFHVAVRTQINKFVFYFIVGRNVKFGCSEC